jgi:hypothetical protein
MRRSIAGQSVCRRDAWCDLPPLTEAHLASVSRPVLASVRPAWVLRVAPTLALPVLASLLEPE